MKKYVVTVYEVHSIDIDVEAEDEDQAREKANDIMCEEDTLITEYDHTMDVEDWPVLELGEVE
jgi:hypothetical protein